jgi:hypothetical protein
MCIEFVAVGNRVGMYESDDPLEGHLKVFDFQDD